MSQNGVLLGPTALNLQHPPSTQIQMILRKKYLKNGANNSKMFWVQGNVEGMYLGQIQLLDQSSLTVTMTVCCVTIILTYWYVHTKSLQNSIFEFDRFRIYEGRSISP